MAIGHGEGEGAGNFTYVWRTHCWLICHKFKYSIREGITSLSISIAIAINLMNINKFGGGEASPPQ